MGDDMIEWLTNDVLALLSAAEGQLESLVTPTWYRDNLVPLFNIVMIDLMMAGDNAILVGLAASRVAPDIRAKVIFWGITAAVVLRVMFAAVTTQLLGIVGLTLAGGLLLLFVCWKMYRQLTVGTGHALADVRLGLVPQPVAERKLSFGAAVWQITLADLAMSLDNVLAVAGAAKKDPLILLIGLGFAIVIMAVASHYVSKLLVRYPVVTWLGLLIVALVAFDMIYEGSHEVFCQAYFATEPECMQWSLLGYLMQLLR